MHFKAENLTIPKHPRLQNMGTFFLGHPVSNIVLHCSIWKGVDLFIFNCKLYAQIINVQYIALNLILKFQNHKPSHLGLLLVFCLVLRSGSIPRPLCCDQAPSCLVFTVRSNVSNGSFGFLKTISDKHQYNSIYCFMCCQSANH